METNKEQNFNTGAYVDDLKKTVNQTQDFFSLITAKAEEAKKGWTPDQIAKYEEEKKKLKEQFEKVGGAFGSISEALKNL